MPLEAGPTDGRFSERCLTGRRKAVGLCLNFAPAPPVLWRSRTIQGDIKAQTRLEPSLATAISKEGLSGVKPYLLYSAGANPALHPPTDARSIARSLDPRPTTGPAEVARENLHETPLPARVAATTLGGTIVVRGDGALSPFLLLKIAGDANTHMPFLSASTPSLS